MHKNSQSPLRHTTCLPKVSSTSKAATESSAPKDVKGGNDKLASRMHPKPKPRVIHVRKQPPSLEITPRASESMRRTELPLRTKSPVPSDTNCPGKLKPKPRPRIKQKPPEPTRNVPQEFPMSLSAKENLSDGGNSTDNGTTTNKNKNKGRSKMSAHQDKMHSFPIPSPLRGRQQLPPKAKSLQPETTFPSLSPLSKTAYSACTPKKKGRNYTGNRNEDEDGTPHVLTFARTGVNVRPFPMSTQLLESIDHRSPGSPAKRVSDDSDAGSKRASKKAQGLTNWRKFFFTWLGVRGSSDTRSSSSKIPDGLDYMDNLALEDDSIDIGYAKDPSTLCPYCDEPLPPHPTPSFQSLLSKARKKSRADPRPRNPRGLAAPLAIYISVCQRHRFESHQLPIALERGWPQFINFKNKLSSWTTDVAGNIDEDDDTRGPRNQCVFWKEVKKEVKKQGSRTTVGVKGQFASFERFNQDIPETAVRLIAQDLGVDMDYAIMTLHESARYGVAMFPDTGGSDGKRVVVDEDEEMGVADQIVMERARARRKELEEEERVEEGDAEWSETSTRSRSGKRRALTRVKGLPAEVDSEASEAMSVDSSSSRRRLRSSAKSSNKMAPERRSATSDDSETGELVDASKRGKGKNSEKEDSANIVYPVDDEPTPRPSRCKDSAANKVPAMPREPNHTSSVLHPLQVARNRKASTAKGNNTSGSSDPWYRNLRASVPEDSDDCSEASRTGRKSRPAIRSQKETAAEMKDWLLTGSSSES
ncbi:hypothetical protein EDC04DRAFT_2889918 [Pisolithus marmoratus]|nr:hypothetical protein EDC04DRAFT_2889918 [Pisolithus marmoratus]